jgi:hypothetical protein
VLVQELAISLIVSIVGGLVAAAVWEVVHRSGSESQGRSWLGPFLTVAVAVFVVAVLAIAAVATTFPSEVTTSTPGMVSLTVPGSASAGIRYSVPVNGLYRITIDSGMYSPWQNDTVRQGQWRTLIDMYLDAVVWDVTTYSIGGDKTPSVVARIGFVGCDSDLEAQTTAADCGKGSTTDIRLEAGHDLVLMPVDEQGQYGGNRGAINFTIEFLGP